MELMKNSKYISEQAAIELLKRIFGSTDADEMTLDEIYAAAGRTDQPAKTNRGWLNGVQTKLQYYKFVKPVMKFENSRNKLDKLRLTIAGKTVLGRAADNADGAAARHEDRRSTGLTLDEMLAAVEELRKKYTAFDIELIVKPKDTPMQQR